MIVFISIVAILFIFLYLREHIKRKEFERDYFNLENDYAKVISNNIDNKNKIKDLSEKYNKKSKLHQEIADVHNQTRTLKHDMKNHIMVVTSFLNKGENEKAIEYLSKITDNLNKIYTYIETGNSLLNFIINSKVQKAKDYEIDVKAEIQNLSFGRIGSIDFSALLNNILDNAIEASRLESKKEIIVYILKKRGYDTILIKNKISKSVLKSNPNLISTKKDNKSHGYGLNHVKSIVNKYDGMLDIYEEDNFFCVYVVYPA